MSPQREREREKRNINKVLLYRKMSANKCRLSTECSDSGKDCQWMLNHQVGDCW